MKQRYRLLNLCVFLLAFASTRSAETWTPAQGPLLTRWAKDVNPNNAWREYPRPQLQRRDWLNLNGLWDYAVASTNAPQPAQFEGKILVPFAIESALSGVMKEVGPTNRLWYHRTFNVPTNWKGKKVLLNFGAIDWESKVWVNGSEIGAHAGG